MVHCYSCKTFLKGDWNLKYQGHDNGLELGVEDACFAYNGKNWIYCLCPNCYRNGNFPNQFKDWYAEPLKKILSQLQHRDKQIEKLNSIVGQRDVEIEELKKTIKKMKYYEKLISQKQVIKIKVSDEYIMRSKNLLNKMDEQFKNYIDIMKEKFSQIIEQVTKQRISSMLTKLEDQGTVLIQEITKVQSVIEKFKEIMKQTKGYKQQELFHESQIEKNQQPLIQKIKMKTEELSLLREAVREGRRFLEIN